MDMNSMFFFREKVEPVFSYFKYCWTQSLLLSL